ncbi:MAG: YcjF family protein [Hyphomicrobium sp.]
MTAPAEPRKPRAFAPDDPAMTPTRATSEPTGSPVPPPAADPAVPLPPAAVLRRGIRWGSIFLAAMAALASLAAGLAFTRFVADAIARDDWIGWTATALAAIGVLAAAVIVVKELIGIFRLGKLAGLRKDIDAALSDADRPRERKAVERLKLLLGERPDLQWGLKRLAEHESDVTDSGDLLRLAERELLVPLDQHARGLIVKSAKRVSMVTALSPFVWAAMLFVLAENLRLLRRLAGLYGGRPGFVGSVRLARLVIGHIVATGGLAMTDDLLGQFLGQDLLGRLSRRLGEGTFNGAMTARIGTAAIEVTRPMPFLEAEAVRVRDLLPELLRSWTTRPAAEKPAP